VRRISETQIVRCVTGKLTETDLRSPELPIKLALFASEGLPLLKFGVDGFGTRMKTLCVFCGSNFGADPAYRASAVQVGSLLAARGLTLVYGGGKVGMMGALADSCLSAAGRVIGIIPKSLAAKEIAHQNLTELRVVDSMHERKKVNGRSIGCLPRVCRAGSGPGKNSVKR